MRNALSKAIKFAMVQIEALAQGITVCNFVLAPTKNRLPRAIGQPLVSIPGHVKNKLDETLPFHLFTSFHLFILGKAGELDFPMRSRLDFTKREMYFAPGENGHWKAGELDFPKIFLTAL